MASPHAAPQGDSPSPWSCNFLVMSAAGKPVYARHGNEDQIGRICGLLQALRSSIASLPSLGGDIRSLRSENLCLVFMSVGSLTLVAIGKESDTEAYLKIQLEYIYGQLLLNLTQRVQDYFAFDPGFDLRSVLGSADASIIDGILDEASPEANPGPFLLGAAETLFPIGPALRARASRALKVTGLKTEFTAFAILAAGEKLVTMIQPATPQHQMRIADLQLLLKVVNRQPHLLSSELWIPVCLPLFSSKDFLFCYTQCWDETSQLCLILVSQQSTTQQFQLFREAAANIRRSLDLPPTESTVLEILDSNRDVHSNGDNKHHHFNEVSNGNVAESPSRDVKWRRSEEDPNLDDDYETVSYGDLDAVLPYLPSPARVYDRVFLQEVRAACCSETIQGHMKHYMATGSALHFLFRMDVPLLPAFRPGHNGKFGQCVSSPLGFPFMDEASKRRVWATYQKLRLRLCLGSATVESAMEAWDATSKDHPVDSQKETFQTGTETAKHFAAMSLANTSPEILTITEERLTFVMDRTELYIAMKGKDYEFYTILPGTTSLQKATSSATKLVRRLFADQRSLFLYHPMTWDV